MDAYAALLERGISPTILTHFGVRLGRRWGLPYWEYPVWDAAGQTVSWRCKRACAHKNAPKYAWLTERLPSRADALYNALEIAAGKEALICAGEPDVWLATTLRYHACSFLAGEGCAPEAATEALRARKPSHAVVAYDNDEAGHKGAVTLVRRLRDLGVPAAAKRLPDEVGPGGDITDLYRVCGKDSERFYAAFRALPFLEIPPPAQEPPTVVDPRRPHLHVPSGASPIERFKAEHAIEEVVEASGVALTPHAGGSYLTARCPFHSPDAHPSFVVWPERAHFRCYGCGVRGDVLDYARLYAGKAGRYDVAS